ncbi:hypothetical protein NI389_02415 [Pseudoalteromonas xiamenensis]|uniref:hypothetical protein n=1 Tax=Pseudoalteromonas xiamenensis TaxID=882626 RepID=UPI0027E5A5A3|nr:hypothetical protein [Pseudoalteromonas xiamenensis]WMN60292.1 hypothetical protein NI389_02415 [Pseudoalteromonas xiamenensis]
MKNFLLALIAVFAFVGCGGGDDAASGDKNAPSYNAVLFFDALYNKHNLNAAIEFSTPKMARIMRSYGTASQFSRNLLNLQYDEVTIEVDMTNESLREVYGDESTVNLIFTGYWQGKKIDDMRSVKMLRKKGVWYVDKIIYDPYAR